MSARSIDVLKDLPLSENCFRIEFEHAEVRPGTVNGTHVLIVSGHKPCINMKVDLNPVYYGVIPDYWEIEVIGCQGDICLPTTWPYTATYSFHGSMGKKGVEVVGANNQQKKIDVP